MITYLDGCMLAELGYGDVCINGGSIIEDGKRIGMVGLSNQDPREIGAVGAIVAGTPCKIGDFPVALLFHDARSIDVIIEQLQVAKSEMIGGDIDVK